MPAGPQTGAYGGSGGQCTPKLVPLVAVGGFGGQDPPFGVQMGVPVQDVLTRRLQTGLSSTQSTPSDAIARMGEAAKGTL